MHDLVLLTPQKPADQEEGPPDLDLGKVGELSLTCALLPCVCLRTKQELKLSILQDREGRSGG